ncbi:MAG: DUF1549 and DUF1553 domain-containing protein [Nitrospira sp.]|nr:DUF1549 and DUF1553 domain-containing protein [Nitrospira sp.]
MLTRLVKSGRVWRWAALMIGVAVGSADGAETIQPQTQLINEELAKAWKAADLKPSKKATDFEFVRRAFIDIIGRIPTVEEVRDFTEGSPNRTKLIHRLLYERDYKPRFSERVNPKDPKSVVSYDYAAEHARHFSNLWTVWLMTRGGVADVYHDQMALWLEEQFLKNTPWNEIVRQLLTATGKTNENGAVAFVMAHLGEQVPRDKQMEDGRFDAIPITSRVTRLFLGIQTNCIQCHDHPFNTEWKQDNFWGVNAFFRQVERDGTPAPAESAQGKKKMVANPVGLRDNPELNKSGRIFFERRSGIVTAAKPNFLPDLKELESEGSVPKRPIPPGSSKTRREHLAEYIVKHDNFAKAYVNRLWAHFFGRGLNELPAADDFGAHNKVVHPELLNRLAEEFIKYGYDTKKLIEWICNSDAYSLSYQANGLPDGKGGNAKDEAAPYFTRMMLKAMSPEVLFESLEVATRLDAAPDKDAKKAKREAWLAKLTRNFGDDEGNEVTFNGTIIQALLMMNGPELNSEISRKDGTSAIDKAMNKHRTGAGYNEWGVVSELYLMALARRPSDTIMVSIPRRDPKTGQEIIDRKTGKPVIGATMSEAAFLRNQIAELRKRARGPQDYRAFFEDLFWSLLNTNEFILNH